MALRLNLEQDRPGSITQQVAAFLLWPTVWPRPLTDVGSDLYLYGGDSSLGGYDGSRFLMGWTGGFVLLTILMVHLLRKFNKATVPDFVGDRYYRSWHVGCSGVCDFHLHDLYYGSNAWSGVFFRSSLALVSPLVSLLAERLFSFMQALAA